MSKSIPSDRNIWIHDLDRPLHNQKGAALTLVQDHHDVVVRDQRSGLALVVFHQDGTLTVRKNLALAAMESHANLPFVFDSQGAIKVRP